MNIIEILNIIETYGIELTNISTHNILFIGAEHIMLKCPNGKEGPGDVIIGNSCLRLVIFIIAVFLVSCCTIVVLVSGLPFGIIY